MSNQSKKWQEIASQGIAIERALRIRIEVLEAALREIKDCLLSPDQSSAIAKAALAPQDAEFGMKP